MAIIIITMRNDIIFDDEFLNFILEYCDCNVLESFSVRVLLKYVKIV